MSAVRLKLLQQMPIFGGVSSAVLQLLLDTCPSIDVEENDYFFRENEIGDSMFVLQSGQVHVLKSWLGQEYLLQILNTGDCFGEMAVIDHCQRSASVRATEACSAIQITSAMLYKIYGLDLKQFTLIQMNMGREVSRRLREADERLFAARLGNLEADLALSTLTQHGTRRPYQTRS